MSCTVSYPEALAAVFITQRVLFVLLFLSYTQEVRKLKINLKFPKISRPSLLSILSALLISLPLIVSVVYDFTYQGRVIPGVYLGELDLSGKTAAQASIVIQNVFRLASPSATIKIGPKEFLVSGSDFDYKYNAEETLQKVMLVGREGSPWDMTQAQWRAFFNHIKLSPVYFYSSIKLEKVLATIEVQVARPAKNASFAYQNGQVLVVPEETGWELSKEIISERLISKFYRFDYTPIETTVKATSPTVYKEDLAGSSARVTLLLSSLPVVTFEGRTWKLKPETILSYLKFGKENDVLAMSLDESVVSNWLTVLAKEINTDARGQVLQVDGGKVVNFVPSQTGYTVNVAASAAKLKEGLLADTSSKTIELVVEKRTPPISANSYGVKELIGLGESNFYGSIPGRIHNLDLASSRLSGALIAPGEEVSFNKLVGEVTAETGYDEAYIISEGRTVLGTGGGLCQVSTTLFRAALNAGLPILARTAHAYRVHYYEPPLGLDATVYSPSVDLVFKNDTPAYILIQREINIAQNYLAFKIYGTSDGRVSIISAPVITNERGAPATLYQEDPTLPKGQTRQVDWSAPGATATVYRKVTRGGEVLQDDTFVSHYQPWRAVFLVGTKE